MDFRSSNCACCWIEAARKGLTLVGIDNSQRQVLNFSVLPRLSFCIVILEFLVFCVCDLVKNRENTVAIVGSARGHTWRACRTKRSISVTQVPNLMRGWYSLEAGFSRSPEAPCRESTDGSGWPLIKCKAYTRSSRNDCASR